MFSFAIALKIICKPHSWQSKQHERIKAWMMKSISIEMEIWNGKNHSMAWSWTGKEGRCFDFRTGLSQSHQRRSKAASPRSHAHWIQVVGCGYRLCRFWAWSPRVSLQSLFYSSRGDFIHIAWYGHDGISPVKAAKRGYLRNRRDQSQFYKARDGKNRSYQMWCASYSCGKTAGNRRRSDKG